MISKCASAGAILAVAFLAAGCSQPVPPASVMAGVPSASPTIAAGDAPAAGGATAMRLPGPVEATGREVGEIIDDATITTRVKSALLQAADVEGLDVKVETDKAVVQLSGFVANEVQIAKALELARGVPGVREVQNKMSVKPS
jgi:PBP1b-binding outer membrane lipoprotein LpoB